MSRGARRIAVGVSFALALAAISSVEAAPTVRGPRGDRAFRPVRNAPMAPSLFDQLRSLFASVVGNPHGPQLTQGPTVDPNGSH